jgi:hypothetical protein
MFVYKQALLTYGVPVRPVPQSPYAVPNVKYPDPDGGIPIRSPVKEVYPYVPKTGTTYNPEVAGVGTRIWQRLDSFYDV